MSKVFNPFWLPVPEDKLNNSWKTASWVSDPEEKPEEKPMSEHEQWQALARRIRKVNDANGWDAPTWDNLPTKLMLTVTELHEAAECEQGGRDPLEEELADVVIRVLDMLESLWPGDWAWRICPGWWSRFGSLPDLLWPILQTLCEATERWRHNKVGDACVCLEYALRDTKRLANTLGIDLLSDAQKKVEKNAGRGHLHGKVRSDG